MAKTDSEGKRTIRLDIPLRLLNSFNVRLGWTGPLRAAFEAEQAERDA